MSCMSDHISKEMLEKIKPNESPLNWEKVKKLQSENKLSELKEYVFSVAEENDLSKMDVALLRIQDFLNRPSKTSQMFEDLKEDNS